MSARARERRPRRYLGCMYVFVVLLGILWRSGPVMCVTSAWVPASKYTMADSSVPLRTAAVVVVASCAATWGLARWYFASRRTTGSPPACSALSDADADSSAVREGLMGLIGVWWGRETAEPLRAQSRVVRACTLPDSGMLQATRQWFACLSCRSFWAVKSWWVLSM